MDCAEGKMVVHKGGCHCGKVRFEIDAPERKGFLHLIVPKSRFRLGEGSQEALSLYTFGTHTAKHYFCSTCGIGSFYIPRSNPDGYSVNARCLDEGTVKEMRVIPFDGVNWENAAALAHKSKE
ncbi:carbonsulfur lyase, putative [Acanthamoeba castellanii str. Neff]|uniref:Carbonsulfur lyase, putative n=1 Tax=Acanthamoeba castellanii (strain ATCC 30010 / Neff) TaxID=1257118 RepID=L8H3Z6_ACACF|nr:carbonsulfur lyase, putative [Acanthamoeba castellanii str. Neff]ELR19920.1 carbonsulfur lyase, putative [Acanthamoeba castellanii str. Neff]